MQDKLIVHYRLFRDGDIIKEGPLELKKIKTMAPTLTYKRRWNETKNTWYDQHWAIVKL